MVWYPVIGYSVFWIGLIASIVILYFKRKFYPIMYLISIALYIFTVGFVIDVFHLKTTGILLVLGFSAVVMLGAGFYLSKKFKK